MKYKVRASTNFMIEIDADNEDKAIEIAFMTMDSYMVHEFNWDLNAELIDEDESEA